MWLGRKVVTCKESQQTYFILTDLEFCMKLIGCFEISSGCMSKFRFF